MIFFSLQMPLRIEIINFRAQKQNADTEIQPQHQKNNGGQASIHVGVVAEVVKVNGKCRGKPNPAQGGEDGAGNLEAYVLFFIWNDGIQAGENHGEDG